MISPSGQDMTWRTLVAVITVTHSDCEFTLRVLFTNERPLEKWPLLTGPLCALKIGSSRGGVAGERVQASYSWQPIS